MLVHYAAAKAGVVGFTKALAIDVGPRGVTVNAIAPGLVDTRMLRGSGLSDAVPSAGAMAQLPIRRLGTPEDIAAACLSWCRLRPAGSPARCSHRTAADLLAGRAC